MSLLAFLVPAALLAGADLSSWAYPPLPPAPNLIEPGSAVTLLMEGRTAEGAVFLANGTVNATVGSSDLVAGLDAQLIGLAPGDFFNIAVEPQDGYGLWNASRTAPIPRFEPIDRVYTVSLAAFRASEGTPYAGERVATNPWPSTVVSFSAVAVTLEYQPALNATVSLYRYWSSSAVAFDNTTVTCKNLLYVGFEFTMRSSTSGKALLVRVTNQTDAVFTLDLNPPLAGQTLHYAGRVVAVAPGNSSVKAQGVAQSLASASCEQCHLGAGFQAMEASAAASRAGDSIVVNLTVLDPWQHDLTSVTGAASLPGNGSGTPAPVAAADLGPGGQENFTLAVPRGGNATLLSVVVNATAHHVHASGGKPSDIPYQITIRVPIGGATHALTASKAPRGAADDWALAGRVTGFAALGLVCFPAVQGMRRHLHRPPRFKWPPWLTAHFTLSVTAIVLTLVHAVALMSSTYRGVWTWDIIVGVLALFALGTMGVTGVLLAKWTPARWPRARKVHFWLMIGMLVTGIIHTIASGTTFRQLIGGS